MKKLPLLVFFLFLILTTTLSLSPKANAQTGEECAKTRARASYNCLTGRTKCIYSCTDQTKDVSVCDKTCSQSNDACEKQVEVDYQACLGAIKKDSESPPETNSSSEVQTNTDCHGVFTKESNSCLKESTKCIDSCVEKGNAAMSLTVDGGKVMKECTRSVCDPASRACNDKTVANFRACQDAKKDKQTSGNETSKNTQNNPFMEFTEDAKTKVKGLTDWIVSNGLDFDIEKIETGTQSDKPSNIAPKDQGLAKKDSQKIYYLGMSFAETGMIKLPNSSEFIEIDKARLWSFPSGSIIKAVDNPVKIHTSDDETIIVDPGSEMTLSDERPILNLSKLNKPEILSEIEQDAWAVSSQTKNELVDIPGYNDTKRYSWGVDSGVTIKSTDWENIKFKEPSQTGSQTVYTLELEQGAIEVKVRNDNPAENQFGVDAGWLGVTVSRTHFSVFKDPNGKLAVVSVYEGEVEVKTQDGKIVKVKPDGDRPGVIVVSKRLSLVKIGITGAILIGIIGGIFILLKRN